MENPTPTRVHFFQVCYYCILGMFCPSKLEKEEEKDNQLRSKLPKAAITPSGSHIVNRAFWNSLVLIILFSLIGCLTGIMLKCFTGRPTSISVIILQALGAALLLWGTLFVRGFEIQTYDGVTLSERVNQWLYRALYCLGTAIIICSLVWAHA
jgi:hypothetical protein